MIINGFSIFGFDLFGLGRREQSARKDEPEKPVVSPSSLNDEEDDEFEIHQETFFWGMYPVY